MPTKSKKQKRTLQAAAHNPAFAQKVGISPRVAEEFLAADKRKAEERKGKKKK
jgi:hypothetical protein